MPFTSNLILSHMYYSKPAKGGIFVVPFFKTPPQLIHVFK